MAQRSGMRMVRRMVLTSLLSIGLVGSASAQDLLIFGGRGHDVFLGCLSCSRFESDSVLNSFGKYGSEFSSDSIWNQFSQYGGQFSAYSPCNRMATDPPVVVDRDGGFYGYLTVNTAKYQRITDRTVLDWLENEVCR